MSHSTRIALILPLREQLQSSQFTCIWSHIVISHVPHTALHHPSPPPAAKGAIDQGSLHEQALDKLRYLEQKARPAADAEESTAQAPVFTQPVRDVRLVEGQPLHFEARLIPVGDANLRVEWFKNGVPLQQGEWRGLRDGLSGVVRVGLCGADGGETMVGDRLTR